MKIWTKILSFNLLLLLGLSLSAAMTDDDIYRKNNIPVLDQPKVMGYLSQANKLMIDGKDGKPIKNIVYQSYASTIKRWQTSRYLEVDTEIDQSWYEKMYTLMTYMAKAKDYIEVGQFNHKQETKEYKDAVANFTLAYQRFNELLKKPTEVDPKKLSKLRRDKRDWLRKTREKLERQEKK